MKEEKSNLEILLSLFYVVSVVLMLFNFLHYFKLITYRNVGIEIVADNVAKRDLPTSLLPNKACSCMTEWQVAMQLLKLFL